MKVEKTSRVWLYRFRDISTHPTLARLDIGEKLDRIHRQQRELKSGERVIIAGEGLTWKIRKKSNSG